MKILHGFRTGLFAICLLAAGTTLLIVSGCANYGRPHESVSEADQDHAITSRIQAAYANNDDYKFSDVQVETFRRSVKLKGAVDSDAHRLHAGAIAEQVGGVKEVLNYITVQ